MKLLLGKHSYVSIERSAALSRAALLKGFTENFKASGRGWITLCLTLLFHIFPDSSNSQIHFQRHTIDSNLKGAYWVMPADIDQDTDLDLVTASYQGIEWWDNTPTGFVKNPIGPLRGAWAAHAADVDLDGDVDVMGAASGDDEFAFWERKGNGFSHTSLGLALGPESIHAGDLDGDGDLDLVGAAWGDDQIIWWRNEGRGDFSRRLLDDRLNNPHSVFVADLDKDGVADVIAAAVSGTFWYRNEGRETFTRREIHKRGGWSVYAADIDNDGDQDVLRTQRDNGDVVLFKNDGSGDFSSQVIEPGFGECWSIVAGDIDADGRKDIVAAGFAANQIRVWRNLGSANFSSGTVIDEVSEPRAVAIGDLDNDGDGDVSAAVRGDRDLVWYEVTASATESKSIQVTYPNGSEQLVVNSNVTVTWESAGSVANVKIDYSPDDANNWLPVVASTANDGAFNWVVPNISTALARVRVAEVANAGLSDASDGPFTIVASGLPPNPPASEREVIVLNDPLTTTTAGSRNGGQFTPSGWQVTGVEDMIVYDLGRYIEHGSFEIDLTNFDPSAQNTLPRHHVLSMFRNPWGNHNPAENPETVWDLHTGFRYDPGVKFLSWTLDQEENATKIVTSWNKSSRYRVKMEWQGNELRYFRDGILQTTHTHSGPMQLRYLFVGRDFTVSGDLVTKFKNNQYPAMLGPIYSNLVVREFVSPDDLTPPSLQVFAPQDLYANGARLSWATNGPAVCFVEYGTTTAYGQSTPILGPPEQSFSTTLFRLLPNTTYHYRIVAVDDAGNRTVSTDFTVRTLAGDAYVFRPIADTFVEDANVYNTTRDHANFGWMSLLASAGREIYLRFAPDILSGLVGEAYLRLHARQGGSGELEVKSGVTDWHENEVTWRTKPFVSGSLLGVLGDIEAGKWSEISVGSTITGNGTHEFAVLGDNDMVFSFDSRESLNFQPELVVLTNQIEPQAPKILSFTPTAGAVGTEVTLNGAHFDGAFELSFEGISAVDFSVESDNLILVRTPQGANSGRIGVSTFHGTGSSLEHFEVLESGDEGDPNEGETGGLVTSTFIPTDDSYVRSSRPDANNGTSDELRVRRTSSVDRYSFLKFDVQGLADPVLSAKLKLFVVDGSEDGGEIFLVENTLADNNAPWNEHNLTWNNAPAIAGEVIAELGAVETGSFVVADLGALITGGGVFALGIKNGTSDIATYSSKEGPFAPELVIESGVGVTSLPTISSFTPSSGFIGQEVTISGSGLSAVTEVSFAGIPALSFSVDSSSELRVEIPPPAVSGAITVSTGQNSSVSSAIFTVVEAAQIFSFVPSAGAVGTEITITGANFFDVTDVLVAGQSASAFSVDSPETIRAAVPANASTGPLSVATRVRGTALSTSAFTVISSELKVLLTDDSFVRSTLPTRNYADDEEVRVRKTSSADHYGYFKFSVSGLSSPPLSATLRLRVLEAAQDGGRVYVVSNTYRGTSTLWQEHGLTWENAPTITGSAIHSIGPIEADQIIEIDLTSVITSNGNYSFAIKNSDAAAARYSSKEGIAPADLILRPEDEPLPQQHSPSVTLFDPVSGIRGIEVTISGEHLDEVTEVFFNGRPGEYSVSSNTSITATVPANATTGPITVRNAVGEGRSPGDFTVIEETPEVPTVSSFLPSSGRPGTVVTITGTNLDTVSEIRFDHTPASGFTVRSATLLEATVPDGASSGPISLIALEEVITTPQTFTVLAESTGPAVAILTDDAFVRSNRESRNYGGNTELRVRLTDSAAYLTFLKFDVTGLTGPPQSAKLRLKVLDDGPEGGEFYLAKNDFKGSNNPWTEDEIHWANAPEIIQPSFFALGEVSSGAIVEVDVTNLIAGPGTYSFAIRNSSSDATKYSSKEGILAPQLVIQGQGEIVPVVSISAFHPASGVAGTEVTILGDNLNNVKEVFFNGTPASEFTVDTATQLRAVAPPGVSTGEITLSGSFGLVASQGNFFAEAGSGPLVFLPLEDTFIRSKNPTNVYGSSAEMRVRETSSDSTIAFLKFELQGLPPNIESAKIRLHVLDGSSDGGSVFSVSNNFRGTGTPWSEDDMDWNNSPLVNGVALAGVGAVEAGAFAEFDVTPAIVVDGHYSFAIFSGRNDVAKYSSKEGAVTPELLIESAPPGAAGLGKSHLEAADSAPLEADLAGLPQSLELYPNYPNPFNLETTIQFALPNAGRVEVVVYNIRGQEVRRLFDGQQTAGLRRFRWDGRDEGRREVSSGVYFVELNAAQQTLVRKITLQK